MLANQTVFKNTSLLLLSLVIQKILSFIYFSYLATRLGVQQTGLYFYILAITAVTSVLLDFGLNNLLIREIASDRNNQNKYLTNAVLLKIIYLILVNSLFFIIYFFGFFGTINNLALGLAVLIMNVETITIFLYSLQRSIHITIYESMGNIIFQTSLLLLGYLALRQFPQVTVALSCLLVAAFVNFSFAAWQTKKSSFNFVVKFIDYIFLKDFFILSWPFALMAIANRIYGYQDVFLLRALAGEQAVGFYSLPYKITFVFQFIPLALIAALYPAFSYWWQQNHEQLMNLFERSVTILLLIVCPIVISIYYYSTDIMLLIYGWPYYPAANILQLLILSLPFIFINFPVGYLLNAAKIFYNY